MRILRVLTGSALLMVLVGTTQIASAVEILRWERLPLAIPLRINQERIVFVDQNVRVGLPRSLTEKLRVQSTGGAIYLFAKEAIEPTRSSCRTPRLVKSYLSTSRLQRPLRINGAGAGKDCGR